MAQQFYAQREGRSGEWRCVVVNKPWGDAVDVYLMRQANGVAEIASIGKDGLIETKQIKEGAGAESKPLFTLNYFAWQSVLQAMGDIEPDIKKEVIDSELKATKYHLEDLRKLVFKP